MTSEGDLREPEPGQTNGPVVLPAKDAGRVTPMMAQYLEIKAAHPDCLLFYRMGDFYELFFQDAEIASRALGIVLTKRGKHEGEDIRMCGVPIERADDYLQRLIGLGHRVAVCEQLEDPAEAKRRGAKSVVRRDVVRLVTPGTITEDRLLEPGRANLLAAVQRVRAGENRVLFGLAALDISTGAFSLSETDEAGPRVEIPRLPPRGNLPPPAFFVHPPDAPPPGRTPAGARRLAERLASPLTRPSEIIERLDAVDYFAAEARLRADLRATLGAAPDFIRALLRLSLDRGGPRDLAAVRDGLRIAREVGGALAESPTPGPYLNAACARVMNGDRALEDDLAATLSDELPLNRRASGFVRPGALARLDEARALRDESRRGDGEVPD